MEFKINCLQDHQIVEFPQDLVKFTNIFNQQKELTIDSNSISLNKIKMLLDAHNYDPSQFQVNTPVLSGNLSQNMDQISFSILQEENEETIKPLLEAVEYLNIDILRELLISCLGCEYFVGDRDEFLKNFKEKYGMSELDKDEEDEIIEQSQQAFYDLYSNSQIDQENKD